MAGMPEYHVLTQEAYEKICEYLKPLDAGSLIDDTQTLTDFTWSSHKIEEELDKIRVVDFVLIPNVNNEYQMTKDVNQKLVLKENAKLLLPVTTDPIDVRLVFEGIDNPNLTLPAVKWESEDEPNIVEGYVYDILFQYIDDKIGWLAGYIKYA